MPGWGGLRPRDRGTGRRGTGGGILAIPGAGLWKRPPRHRRDRHIWAVGASGNAAFGPRPQCGQVRQPALGRPVVWRNLGQRFIGFHSAQPGPTPGGPALPPCNAAFRLWIDGRQSPRRAGADRGRPGFDGVWAARNRAGRTRAITGPYSWGMLVAIRCFDPPAGGPLARTGIGGGSQGAASGQKTLKKTVFVSECSCSFPVLILGIPVDILGHTLGPVNRGTESGKKPSGGVRSGGVRSEERGNYAISSSTPHPHLPFPVRTRTWDNYTDVFFNSPRRRPDTPPIPRLGDTAGTTRADGAAANQACRDPGPSRPGVAGRPGRELTPPRRVNGIASTAQCKEMPQGRRHGGRRISIAVGIGDNPYVLQILTSRSQAGPKPPRRKIRRPGGGGALADKNLRGTGKRFEHSSRSTAPAFERPTRRNHGIRRRSGSLVPRPARGPFPVTTSLGENSGRRRPWVVSF